MGNRAIVVLHPEFQFNRPGLSEEQVAAWNTIDRVRIDFLATYHAGQERFCGVTAHKVG